ncbi:caspase family protein [Streptomyces sp. NPDC051211]|uniref:caspase family protein n=1 Tax=Streptomyces sp. NPDC051211 TaxID=3154643 RepID=UPI00344E306D
MPTGLSIHVGLNEVDPDKYDGWDGKLLACENDARDMAEVARARGFEDTVILTPDGTVDNITAALREAAGRLRTGDMLLFTYSGHGGQIDNLAGSDDEADRLDETLVFYDRQFLDDELYRELQRFEQDVRIFVLLDCCHSGSSIESIREMLTPDAMEARFQTRDPEQIEATSRLMPLLKQQEIAARDRSFFTELQRELKDGERDGPAQNAVLIGACQDNQLASDGQINGLFTEQLLKVWRKGAFEGDHRTFHRDIQKRMPAIQSPNLYTTGRPTFLDQRPFTI